MTHTQAMDEDKTDCFHEYETLLGPERADLYDAINSLYQGSVRAACRGDARDEKKCAHLMRRIAEKTVVRFTPLAKSTHCRRCDTVILDGVPLVPPYVPPCKKAGKAKPAAAAALATAARPSPVRMRIRKGRLVRSCAGCGLVRRVPMPYAPKIAKNQRRRAERKKARRKSKKAQQATATTPS